MLTLSGRLSMSTNANAHRYNNDIINDAISIVNDELYLNEVANYLIKVVAAKAATDASFKASALADLEKDSATEEELAEFLKVAEAAFREAGKPASLAEKLVKKLFEKREQFLKAVAEA